MLSFSPEGETTGEKSFLLAFSRVALGGGVISAKWNCTSCCLYWIQSQIYFFLVAYYNISTVLLDFHRGTLVCVWLTKISVLWGVDGTKFLFCQLYDKKKVGFLEYRPVFLKYLINNTCVESLSHVRLFATPWTVAYQAPPSMRFSRQEYWSGLPFPSPDNTDRCY